MLETVTNNPWFLLTGLLLSLICLGSGIWNDGAWRQIFGGVLFVLCMMQMDGPWNGRAPHSDEELRMAFVEAEGGRFDALGIRQLDISCDPKSKTLTGKFGIEDSAFDKSQTINSKTPCSLEGPVLSIAKPGPKFFLHVYDDYKPKLVLDEIASMMTTQFGAIVLRPELARTLDKKNLERSNLAGMKAVRFLCVDGVFKYDTHDTLLREVTTITCKAVENEPASQLRILSRIPGEGLFTAVQNAVSSDYYVLATQSITPELANTLLGAALDNNGRKTAF